MESLQLGISLLSIYLCFCSSVLSLVLTAAYTGPTGSRSILFSCLCMLLCHDGGPCVVVCCCWPTDVSNAVYLALLLQTSRSCWGSVWPVVVVMLGPVNCPKSSSFPSHMGTHKMTDLFIWALAFNRTRYTIHRCAYGALNHVDSHMHTQENTRKRPCRYTMPIERLHTLSTPYGPSQPSVPLSTCQALLVQSPLPISLLDHSAAPLQ